MTVKPLVAHKTLASSESLETIINRINNGTLKIPDYQRDADQWDKIKESRFIESILNFLTIPAFFFYQENNEKPVEVVDGQQRLSTILKYYRNEIPLVDDEDVIYLNPQSAHYRGKYYRDLDANLQKVFLEYTITIINLPSGLEINTRLEIFHRINDGGTVLSRQDLRLSDYYTSNSVYFIKLVGLHSESDRFQKLIQNTHERNLNNPWLQKKQHWELWKNWWEGKSQSKGQCPSEMFLWYLVMRFRNVLDTLLNTKEAHKHLTIAFNGKTESALDGFCAQLMYDDAKIEGNLTSDKQITLTSIYNGLEDEFQCFADAVAVILSYGLPGISVDKYKPMALIIAASRESNISLSDLNENQWIFVSRFIREPRKTARELGMDYVEQRGNWSGEKGQKAQFDAVVSIFKTILKG